MSRKTEIIEELQAKGCEYKTSTLLRKRQSELEEMLAALSCGGCDNGEHCGSCGCCPGEETTPEPTPEPEPEPEPETTTEDGPATRTFSPDQMKTRIAKMLAKAERTDNDAEREVFLGKAQDLMIRLGIEKAELEAAGTVSPEKIVEATHTWTGIYARLMTDATLWVANGYDSSLTVLQSKSASNQRARRSHVIGMKTDVHNFGLLLASLHVQALRALKVHQTEQAEMRKTLGLSTQEKFVQDRSFLRGFFIRVSERLAEQRRQVVQEVASQGAALVLVSKRSRVDGYMDEHYADLKSARNVRSQYSRIHGEAGREAGNRADLGNSRISGKSALGA